MESRIGVNIVILSMLLPRFAQGAVVADLCHVLLARDEIKATGYRLPTSQSRYESLRNEILVKLRDGNEDIEDLKVEQGTTKKDRVELFVRRQGKWEQMGRIVYSIEKGQLETDVFVNEDFRDKKFNLLMMHYLLERNKGINELSDLLTHENGLVFRIAVVTGIRDPTELKELLLEYRHNSILQQQLAEEYIQKLSVLDTKKGTDRSTIIDSYLATPYGRTAVGMGFKKIDSIRLSGAGGIGITVRKGEFDELVNISLDR